MESALERIYKQHLKYEMSESVLNIHSQGKERYRNRFSGNHYLCQYGEQLYFIGEDYGKAYLCRADKHGDNIEIIVDLGEDYYAQYIHVNVTGIYLYEYQDEGKAQIFVEHYGFDGKLLGKCHEIYAGGIEEHYYIPDMYIYDNRAYFAYFQSDWCQIKCMYVDEGRTEILYDKAARVERIFATKNKLIFRASYQNDECELDQDEGWMIYDLANGSVECLSNPYCSLENIVDDPNVYDEDSARYNKNAYYRRNIVFIDLNRSIFWISHEDPDNEGIEYWEPHNLWRNREEIISTLPIWKINTNTTYSIQKEYFDGIHRYCAESLYYFYATDKYGNVYKWHGDSINSGRCGAFFVSGDYLYLNVEDTFDTERQYALSFEKMNPVVDKCFNNLPLQEAIDVYHGNSEQAHMFSKEESRAEDIYSTTEPDLFVSNTVIQDELYVEKVIGNTDMKYNICTLGSKFHVGFGQEVFVQMNGKKYKGRMHRQTKGRVDGLRKLYVENEIKIGDVVRATYKNEEQTIYLEKI